MRAAPASDAAWTLPAVPGAVAEMRRRASAFATAMGASEQTSYAITLAVSETVTNAVIHAYAGREPGPVSVRCSAEGEQLVIEVADEGSGIAARVDSPGVGQGLAVVGALVRSLEIGSRPDGPGAVVRMSFGGEALAPEAAGLEPLCDLALEQVADVSCLDVVSDGVLRRVAAEVAGDAGLTEWLNGATPPARPGTATWQALHEGGTRLVVHDPTVPRAPGGTGDQLGLTWWLAVPLEGSAALWGLGGRHGGRPVPSEAVIRALAEAAPTDLAEETQRAALRARLALQR